MVKVNYRCFAGNWIAYINNQAIWESYSLKQLLDDLAAKGYNRANGFELVCQRITICKII